MGRHRHATAPPRAHERGWGVRRLDARRVTECLGAVTATVRLGTTMVAACLIAVGALATPAARASTDMLVGVEQNGGMGDPTLRTENLDHMHDLGARIIRFVLRFDQVATCDPVQSGFSPTAPDNPCYDFSVPDAVVRGASDRGMQVVFSIYGAPSWQFGGRFNFTGGTDAEFAAFQESYANFAEAAATRYDGRHVAPRVGLWTIWNEPNGGYFWEPRFVNGELVGPIRYAHLYDAAARRIKSVDATLRVAAGPTAPMPGDLKPLVFMRSALPVMQSLGSPVDAWAHNAYMGTQSPLHSTLRDPIVGLGNIDDLTRELDRFPITSGIPVWITEFGYQTPPAVQATVSVDEQATLLADSLYTAWSKRRIEVFVWYGLFDDGSGDAPTGFQAALYYAHFRCGEKWCPKPSADWYRHTLWMSASSVPRGGTVTLWGQGRTEPAATRIYAWRGGAWSSFVNPDTERTGTVSMRDTVAEDTWYVVCDTACGPIRKVTATERSASGGGTMTVKRPRIERRALRTVLRRGLAYRILCARCRITSARIEVSGAVARSLRSPVAARGRVTTRPSGLDVRFHLPQRFAAAMPHRAHAVRVAVVIRLVKPDGTRVAQRRIVELTR